MRCIMHCVNVINGRAAPAQQGALMCINIYSIPFMHSINAIALMCFRLSINASKNAIFKKPRFACDEGFRTDCFTSKYNH